MPHITGTSPRCCGGPHVDAAQQSCTLLAAALAAAPTSCWSAASAVVGSWANSLSSGGTRRASAAAEEAVASRYLRSSESRSAVGAHHLAQPSRAIMKGVCGSHGVARYPPAEQRRCDPAEASQRCALVRHQRAVAREMSAPGRRRRREIGSQIVVQRRSHSVSTGRRACRWLTLGWALRDGGAQVRLEARLEARLTLGRARLLLLSLLLELLELVLRQPTRCLSAVLVSVRCRARDRVFLLLLSSRFSRLLAVSSPARPQQSVGRRLHRLRNQPQLRRIPCFGTNREISSEGTVTRRTPTHLRPCEGWVQEEGSLAGRRAHAVAQSTPIARHLEQLSAQLLCHSALRQNPRVRRSVPHTLRRPCCESCIPRT